MIFRIVYRLRLKSRSIQQFKMKVNKIRCLYCGGCVGVCPAHAMELREVTLEIDQKKCSKCGICYKFCPVGAIEKD